MTWLRRLWLWLRYRSPERSERSDTAQRERTADDMERRLRRLEIEVETYQHRRNGTES